MVSVDGRVRHRDSEVLESFLDISKALWLEDVVKSWAWVGVEAGSKSILLRN